MFPDGIAASQVLGGGLRAPGGDRALEVPAPLAITSLLTPPAWAWGGLGVFPALCHMPLDLQRAFAVRGSSQISLSCNQLPGEPIWTVFSDGRN